MSTTTESAGLTAGTTGGTTEATAGSWEQAVKRQQTKIASASQPRGGAGGAPEVHSGQRQAAAHMQACRLEQAMVKQLDVVPTGDLLFHPNPAALHGVGVPQPHPQQHPGAPPSHFFQGQQLFGQQAGGQQQGGGSGAPGPAPLQPLHGLDLPAGGAGGRSMSPNPLSDMFSDPLFGGSSAGGHAAGPAGPSGVGAGRVHSLGLGLDDDDLLRIPSPPPLPADWEAAPRAGLLFDFDQFDATKRHQVRAPLIWRAQPRGLLREARKAARAAAACCPWPRACSHARLLTPRPAPDPRLARRWARARRW